MTTQGREQEVTRLLKRGLNHYGLGDVEAAIACWERARALDPENQAVRDYLETAYEEQDQTPQSQVPELVAPGEAKPELSGAVPGAPSEADDTPHSLPRLDRGPAESEADTPQSLPRIDSGGVPAGKDGDGTPAPEPEPAPGLFGSDPEGDPDTLVGPALDAFRGGRLEEAFGELDELARRHPDRLDLRGYLELVRKQLLEQWADEIGDRGRVPRLVPSPQELLRLHLKPEEGFLLSQVDGLVTLEDLISLSTVDRFSTFRMLARFLRERIVE
jgi:tetratricopeptide (TPR) repeat protein